MKVKKKNWYKVTLIKNTKKILSSGSTYLIIVFVILLWHFALGYKFEWQTVKPLSEPSLFIGSFYSAFTFVTLGLFLYLIYFYKVFHDILVKTFGLWGLYNLIKTVVWIFLMYLSYAYIVPWLFDVLNSGISFLFNVANLVLYLSAPLGISLIFIIIYFLFRAKFTLI